MVGRWIYYCGVLMGVFISNVQSSEENYNTTATNIIITDSEAQKRIEVRNPLNSTSSPVPAPAVIQQGNNLFIKPKYIFGSAVTSHKQIYKKNAEGTVTSKIAFAEPNIKIGKPEISELPRILVPYLRLPFPPPPLSVPAGVAHDIPIPILRTPPPPINVPASVSHNVPISFQRIPPPPVIVPEGIAHYNPIPIPRIHQTPVIGPADVIHDIPVPIPRIPPSAIILPAAVAHDIPTPFLGIPPPPINVPAGVAHNIPISFQRIPPPPVIVPASIARYNPIPIPKIHETPMIRPADVIHDIPIPILGIPPPPIIVPADVAHDISMPFQRIPSRPVIVPAGISHDNPITSPRIRQPSVIEPADITHNISIPISRIPIQQQIPIAIPDICQLVRCLPKAIPIPHIFPQIPLPYAAHNIPITNPRISPPPMIISSGVAHHVPISTQRFPPPLVIRPAGVAHNISIPISRISIHPQVPIATPNLCQLMPCRPDLVPIAPYFPQLPPPPILVEKPRLISEPPILSQVISPQSPIQVVVQNPTVPMGERIIVSPFCPMVCNSNGNDSNSIANILNDMYQKFKNMMGSPEPTPRRRGNRTTTTESTTEAEEKQSSTSEKNVACPCMSTQGIIIERFVPDTVPNKEIKVYVSTISPPQLAQKDEEHITPS